MPYTVESLVQPVVARATKTIEYDIHAFAVINAAPAWFNRDRTYSPQRAVVHIENDAPTRVIVTGVVVTDRNRPTRRRTTVVYRIERGTPVLDAAGARWPAPTWVTDLVGSL